MTSAAARRNDIATLRGANDGRRCAPNDGAASRQ
jgi:hypothetical protein